MYKRIRYEDMAFTRNPNPARGRDIYSLDELRHYCRLLFRDRKYGVCHVAGGKVAFARACGYKRLESLYDTLVADPPRNEFLSAVKQRTVSRIVRMVLNGKLYFVTSPTNAGRAMARINIDGTPLLEQPPAPKFVSFRLCGTQLKRVAP